MSFQVAVFNHQDCKQRRYGARWDSADGRLVATLRGHINVVDDVDFSPDGQPIVTARYDQTARIWHVLTLNDLEQILAKLR